MCAMTKFPPRVLMRFEEWFEAHFLRWRPAHVELEDDSDEELKDIGLEPLKRNFTALKPFWKL
jgi:uncharacterized protein YjiS (DUF1127 family)